MVFFVINTNAINIFDAIDNENSLKLELIINAMPKTLEIKHKDLSGYNYNVPLYYAINREMPHKKTVLKLLEPTVKHYKRNKKEGELNIILYNVFRLSLEKAYELNPMNFKEYPDFEIADKILESGFDINYKIDENYGSIKDLHLNIKQRYMLKEAVVKEYLKSKNIQCESAILP